MSESLPTRHATRAAETAPRGPSRRQRGVTMIEVMATTAISAVVLGVAAPNLVDSMRINNARSAAQSLSGLLTEARTEAVKRNVPVLVCPSTDGASCMSTPTASSWKGLTIVCFDTDGNGACDSSTSAAPNPIRVRSAIESNLQVTGPASVVRFNGLGAVASSVSFSLSAGNGTSQTSTISVAATGSVRAY